MLTVAPCAAESSQIFFTSRQAARYPLPVRSPSTPREGGLRRTSRDDTQKRYTVLLGDGSGCSPAPRCAIDDFGAQGRLAVRSGPADSPMQGQGRDGIERRAQLVRQGGQETGCSAGWPPPLPPRAGALAFELLPFLLLTPAIVRSATTMQKTEVP